MDKKEVLKNAKLLIDLKQQISNNNKIDDDETITDQTTTITTELEMLNDNEAEVYYLMTIKGRKKFYKHKKFVFTIFPLIKIPLNDVSGH